MQTLEIIFKTGKRRFVTNIYGVMLINVTLKYAVNISGNNEPEEHILPMGKIKSFTVKND